MREILFRGKRVDNGEWVEGTGINTQYDMHGRKHIYIGVWCFSEKAPLMKTIDWYAVIPETVGQYTGLTDKNGKKIFEGDILDHHVQSDILICRGVVNWDSKNARWALQLNSMNPCFYMHNPKTVEVLGNIHDNPELLEVHNG